MTTQKLQHLVWGMVVGLATAGHCQDSQTPKPIPQSRQEILQALEQLKHRQPRLPLPQADAVVPEQQTAEPSSGTRGIVNNARMRRLYLPEELSARSASRSGSSSGSRLRSPGALSYEFATELFWIVSRINNCHYCLGHQENKLKSEGVSEASLLALDTDWSVFSPAKQAALHFAQQLTLAPHTVSDADIDKLRTHYSDNEILEMAFLIGRYNSTNRWTDSLGIPQEDYRSFTSELQPAELVRASCVAGAFADRPSNGDYHLWKAELKKHSKRSNRLIPSTAAVDLDARSPHERLLASIPAAGSLWVQQLRDAETVGTLSHTLRDAIAFVAAREDRAWYMQRHALNRLVAGGMTPQAAFMLGVSDTGTPAAGAQEAVPYGGQAEQAALTFAIQLTAHPQRITDADIDRLKQHFSPQQIAEIVYHTGLAAMLNRVTEIAGLGYE